MGGRGGGPWANTRHAAPNSQNSFGDIESIYRIYVESDESNPTNPRSTFSTRLSSFGLTPACHVPTLALWRRRRGTIRHLVDRSPPSGWANMVAVATARSNRLRQLALSIAIILCRQWTAD